MGDKYRAILEFDVDGNSDMIDMCHALLEAGVIGRFSNWYQSDGPPVMGWFANLVGETEKVTVVPAKIEYL